MLNDNNSHGQVDMTPTLNVVIAALQQLLPQEASNQIPALADYIIATLQSGTSPPQPPNDPQLSSLLQQLNGQKLQINNGLLQFGADNTFQNVTVGDVAQGNIIKITFNGETLSTWIIPRQAPDPPPHYIPRSEAQDTLTQALQGEPRVTVLYGLSGSGKSSLAAQVIKELSDSAFPDGILWGDLAQCSPGEQILSFLIALNPDKTASLSLTTPHLRDLLWEKLADKRLLMVIDNVQTSAQLRELLPTNLSRIGKCHILAISIHPLEDSHFAQQKLNYFNADESMNLFKRLLDGQQITLYKEQLRAISEHLAYTPQLIVGAAQEFASGMVSPSSYLNLLRQSETPNRLRGHSAWEGLDLVLQHLPAETVSIFEMIGVLGTGDWSEQMLAAITLSPLATVRTALHTLVNHGLVERLNTQRYRVNSFIREFAQQRLQQREPYTMLTAHLLLARYCLDLAQDQIAALQAKPTFQALPEQTNDEAFIRAFRETMFPEISHIRYVLNWAAEHKVWDLLRRFSYVSTMELLRRPVINAVELQMALCMASIEAPIAWKRQTLPALYFAALIVSNGLTARTPPSNDIQFTGPIITTDLHNWLSQSSADTTVHSSNDTDKDEPRCDVRLDIVAGQISDGFFEDTAFIDARWYGVRATGCILHRVDIAGGRLLACDLSHSIWLDCDARRAALPDCNLSEAVIKKSKFRGADLHGAAFIRALLERVDLRGADLREARFDGALLIDVDLRGADLRNADFTMAELRGCSLHDCRIEGARWPNPLPNDAIKEATIRDEIRRNAKPAGSSNPRRVVLRQQPTATDITRNHKETYNYADLCAIDLHKAFLPNAKLRGADLRIANLNGATLSNADLSQAILRAASLVETDLSEAILAGAKLRAANLSQAQLHKADLRGADLSSADLRGAFLDGAICQGANFLEALIDDEQLLAAKELMDAILPDGTRVLLFDRDYNSNDRFPTELKFAHFSGNFATVDLSSAQLFGAYLAGHFDNTTFIQADLRHAKISGQFTDAQFRQADFAGASLAGVYLIGADLSDAKNLTDEQLSHANALFGTRLPDGQYYDGRFELAGDIAQAQTFGFDPNDKAHMCKYYNLGKPSN